MAIQSQLYNFVQEKEFTECIEDEYEAEDESPAKSETGEKLYIVDNEGRETQFVMCVRDEKANSSDAGNDFSEDEAEDEAVETHKSNLEKRRLSGKLGLVSLICC